MREKTHLMLWVFSLSAWVFSLILAACLGLRPHRDEIKKAFQERDQVLVSIASELDKIRVKNAGGRKK